MLKHTKNLINKKIETIEENFYYNTISLEILYVISIITSILFYNFHILEFSIHWHT